jgi:hypothetical protein
MATPRTPVNSNFRTALPGNATQNRGSSSWGLKNDNVEMKKKIETGVQAVLRTTVMMY